MISDNKLNELLKIKQKYLSDCKLCNHTGVVTNIKENDKTWINGNECNCIKEFKRIKNLYLSNIPKAYWNKKLNDIISKDIRDKIKKYIDKIDYAIDNNLSLLLCGKNSGGKTLILSIILKTLIANYNYSCKYYMLEDILNFKEIDNGELDDTKIITIDDVGNEHRKEGSDYAVKTLVNIIRRRIKINKLTLLASKYNFEQLKNIYRNDFENIIKNNYMIINIEEIKTESDIKQKIKGLLE